MESSAEEKLNLFFDKYFINSELLDIANQSLASFFENSSFVQKEKLKYFRENDLLNYSLIFVKLEKNLGKIPYDLYDISCSDFNKYDANFGTDLSPTRTKLDLVRDKHIDHINSMKDTEDNSCFFQSLNNKLDSYNLDISCSYMLYKKGARVKTHQHNPGVMAVHVSLNDLQEGLEVMVNDKCYKLNKKGDFVMIETMQPHGAYFAGAWGEILSFGFKKSLLDNFLN